MSEHLEVYITSTDGHLLRRTLEDDTWSAEWESMGTGVVSQPAAIAWDGGAKVDVYATGSDGSSKRCF